MVSDLLYRLRALLRGRAVERELEEELRFHLEQEIHRHVASGVSRDEATRSARIAFGGVEQIKEECRDARGIRPIEILVQDLRYGLRTWKRAPVLSMTAVATIALSIASLATVFTLGHTLFWRRLPVD